MELAEMLGASRPSGPDLNKKIWISDMIQVFSSYPERDVELMVKDPINGIRRHETFLPNLQKIFAFLDGLAARRGRIMRNARILVDDHAERERDNGQDNPDMARKLQNLSRSLKGLCSLELAEKRRDEQAKFNAYCLHIGRGNIADGIQIMLDRNMTEPPPGWNVGNGWQGEIA